MLTVFLLLAPLTEYSTLPATRAYSVWSRPMPTLTPGCTTVPRWRIRIWPALALSPPQGLPPSRLAVEFAEHQHAIERPRRADFGRKRFDSHLFAGFHAVLLTAGLDHCIHGWP